MASGKEAHQDPQYKVVEIQVSDPTNRKTQRRGLYLCVCFRGQDKRFQADEMGKIKETRGWDIQSPPPPPPSQSIFGGTELGPRKETLKSPPIQDERLNSCSLDGAT